MNLENIPLNGFLNLEAKENEDGSLNINLKLDKETASIIKVARNSLLKIFQMNIEEREAYAEAELLKAKKEKLIAEKKLQSVEKWT